MSSFRLYLYGRDLKIIGKSDFNAGGHVSALNVAHRIFTSCPDTCVRFELWEGPIRISSQHVEDRVLALNGYEQQVVVDTEIALRDSWIQIGESKNLLSALEELQQQMSKRPETLLSHDEREREREISTAGDGPISSSHRPRA